MRSRVPWDVAKRILSQCEIPKGHGWEKTLERLDGRAPEFEAHADDLAEALEEHYICGEKLTRFYELKPKTTSDIRSVLASAKPPKNDFSNSYPALIDQEQIESSYPQKHTLAAIKKNDDGIAAIFASSRAIYVREHIDTNDFPEEIASTLSGYDEVMGVKLIKYQAMDTVWVPHHGNFVDIRVDFPRGMHHDQALVAIERTREAFHQVCGGSALTEPVNLFPLIDLFYKSSGEGNVVEMAFGTTTASLKREKMRRSKTDLRKEIYHQGGKKALKTPIEPYRLSVEYDVRLGATISAPEISFNGNSRMTGSANPILQDVVIRKCIGITDYEYVRDRVEHFIRVHKATLKKK